MAEYKKPRTNKPIKNWFITFPQSRDVGLQTFLDIFMVYPIQYASLVKESHKDGNPHIHMILQFKGSRCFSAMMGRIQKELPNDWKRIQLATLRSKKDADIYIDKDAKEKLEYGEWTQNVKKMPNWLRDMREPPEEKKEEPETRVSDKFTERRKIVQQFDSKIKWIKLKHDTWLVNEYENWFLRYKAHLLRISI